ncbi:MAG: phytanoyl-CoA dioxygenase family protein [Burkholderiales bacterium]
MLSSPGFSTQLCLTPGDLALFRKLIQEQWLARIKQCHPHLAAHALSLGIAAYHELSEDLDHQTLWPKEYRILGDAAVQALKQTTLFEDLRSNFGCFGLAEGFHGNTHIAGLDEVYWRLVRPNAASDVGSLHADHWFHDMMQMSGKAFSRDAYTLKVWIPIYCEPGRNGLLLVPDSHRRDWKYSTRWVNGQPKPQFDDEATPVLVNTPPGNMLVFNERVLHGGAVNRGSQTRVSAEITLVFESEDYLRDRLKASSGEPLQAT